MAHFHHTHRSPTRSQVNTIHGRTNVGHHHLTDMENSLNSDYYNPDYAPSNPQYRAYSKLKITDV